jgi:hypothetical protein
VNDTAIDDEIKMTAGLKKINDSKNTPVLCILCMLPTGGVIMGCFDFPKIALAASRILAKPNANAFQERVFSRSTFVNHPLRQNMSEQTFELRTLNALNRPWIEVNAKEYAPTSEEEALSKTANVILHGVEHADETLRDILEADDDFHESDD